MEPGVDPATDGFTLIELLVVLAIMSALAAGASMALGRTGSAAASDLSRFERAFDTARSLAVHEGRRRGMEINAKYRQSLALTATGWQDTGRSLRWQRPVVFRPDAVVAAGSALPDIQFLPNGQTTSFSIQFGNAGRCISTGWDGLTCAAE